MAQQTCPICKGECGKWKPLTAFQQMYPEQFPPEWIPCRRCGGKGWIGEDRKGGNININIRR